MPAFFPQSLLLHLTASLLLPGSVFSEFSELQTSASPTSSSSLSSYIMSHFNQFRFPSPTGDTPSPTPGYSEFSFLPISSSFLAYLAILSLLVLVKFAVGGTSRYKLDKLDGMDTYQYQHHQKSGSRSSSSSLGSPKLPTHERERRVIWEDLTDHGSWSDRED